jgi:GNAT superfamily N-acetyltransferase
MVVTFTSAGESELDVLLPLMRAYYAEDGYAFEEQTARRALGELLRTPALGRVWLIRAGTRAVGYLALTLGFSLEFGGRDAIVDELFVVPAERGQGLGSRALEVAAAACVEMGVRTLHLVVERSKESAQRLYRRQGFVAADRLLMTRRLCGGESGQVDCGWDTARRS